MSEVGRNRENPNPPELIPVPTINSADFASALTKTIVTDAEVRHKVLILEGSRKGEYRIGVSFKRINPPDRQLVVSHVTEEIRKFYSQFI